MRVAGLRSVAFAPAALGLLESGSWSPRLVHAATSRRKEEKRIEEQQRQEARESREQRNASEAAAAAALEAALPLAPPPTVPGSAARASFVWRITDYRQPEKDSSLPAMTRSGCVHTTLRQG